MTPYPTLEPYANLHSKSFWLDSQVGQETLLLIHGNGDESDTWRHIFVPLSQHFRIVAPDLPGFGRSQTVDSSIVGFAHWLLQLIQHLGLKRVHLCGSSLGGVVAAQFAALFPEQSSSLCMIGAASPALGNLRVSKAVAPLLEPEVGEAYYNGLRHNNPSVAFETLRPYYANLSALSRNDQDFLQRRVWERVQSDRQRDAFFAVLRSLFSPTAPLEVRVPSQLLWGQYDQIVPLEHGKIIQQQIPGTPLAVIPEAGHLPHQEQPSATIEAFLAALP